MKKAAFAVLGLGLIGIAGVAYNREPKKLDTWSLEVGDDAMIVTRNHKPAFFSSEKTMANLPEGTKVRFLGKSDDPDAMGDARVKVLEGPAAGEVGEVLRLELQPFARDHQ